MNRKDLDALSELYVSLYGEENLNEAPGGPARFWDSNMGRFVANVGRTAGDVRDVLYGDPSGRASQVARQRLAQRVTGKPVTEYPDQRAARIAKSQDAAIAAAKPKPPTKNPPKPTGTPPAPPAGSPPRPAASSTVLAKKGGVEGKLDKATGKFTSGAFSSAEKSRYASVAAQNAARNAVPKPPAQTSTPTQTPKPSSYNPLMQKTFGYQTGNAPDQIAKASQGVSQATSDAAFARSKQLATQLGAQATVGNLAGINNKKPNPAMKEQSHEWTSAKTLRDIAEAYQSVYEAKANDGNLANNYPPYDKVTRGDVIAGRLGKDEMGGKRKSVKKEEVELVDEKYMGFKALKASIAARGGVSDPGAVAASIGRKKYGKEKFQKAAAKGRKLGEEHKIYEIVSSYLLENNFASSQENADAIIENMSENWMVQILEETN